METNDLDYPVGTFRSPVCCEVDKVLIRDGMYVEKGQTMFIMKTPTPSSYIPQPLSDESQKSRFKKSLHGLSNLPVVSLVDNQLNTNAAAAANDTSCSSSSLTVTNPPDDVMKRYETFKKFDTLVDHSDNLFSAYTCEMKHPGWTNIVKQEWRILEQHLPETIYVRAYESRMDLLRAVIIGQVGTPYHNGLFFFDVFLPNKYPYTPPLVRYHSGGLGINPNLNISGDVCLSLLNTTPTKESLWVPGMNMRNLLVAIQDLIFNTKPYFNGLKNTSARGSVSGEYLSFLYNENTIVKSLKTMAYAMNKPTKGFEDLVVGHFRKHVRDILVACKAYMEGLQIGCLVSDVDVTCSIEFKNDVASCINSLIDAFYKIGVKEAQEFLPLVRKRKVFIDQDLNNTANKKRRLQDIEVSHGLDNNYVSWSWNVSAPRACLVTKVLVTDGTKVETGQPLYVEDVTYIMDVGHISSADQKMKQRTYEVAGFYINYFLERYKNFKKFDSVLDHSDHFFAAQNFAMNQLPKDWVNMIKEEWRILEEQLPDTIFVRVYQSRMDLLRALIIGPKGTPYHGGLFFFDVCFPSNYPDSPPFVNYHSRGHGINPNMDERGTVCLSFPKINGGGLEPMWVPGSSTMLQLLVSIQNKFLNTKPLFNDPTYALMRGSLYGEQASLQYNEITLIKSLKTMSETITKPPKNFQDFVVGHFHNRACDILMACNKKPCSVTFMNELDLCLKPLIDAFAEIRALDWRVIVLRSRENEAVLELKNKTIYM